MILESIFLAGMAKSMCIFWIKPFLMVHSEDTSLHTGAAAVSFNLNHSLTCVKVRGWEWRWVESVACFHVFYKWKHYELFYIRLMKIAHKYTYTHAYTQIPAHKYTHTRTHTHAYTYINNYTHTDDTHAFSYCIFV